MALIRLQKFTNIRSGYVRFVVCGTDESSPYEKFDTEKAAKEYFDKVVASGGTGYVSQIIKEVEMDVKL